jgi:hypothetical protein
MLFVISHAGHREGGHVLIEESELSSTVAISGGSGEYRSSACHLGVVVVTLSELDRVHLWASGSVDVFAFPSGVDLAEI